MSKDQASIITTLDIGSAKTCALVAEQTENGLQYVAHGVSDSRGSRKGVIVELDKAVASIQKAVDAAEQAAGLAIGNAVVGVGGAHVKGVNSRGGISFGHRSREITRDDVREVIDRARAITLPPDRELLHLLPQEFILDDQGGIREAAGMMASRVEAIVHLVTAASSAMQNVITAANRAGIHVDNTVYEGIASADATLKNDERELGVCLADIGAGSTELTVYYERVVIHTAVVPVGGDHFTNDVAVGLRTPLSEAETIKRMAGCAVVTRVPETNEIEVPAVGERPSRLMPQRLVAEILEPRARELMEMIREALRTGGVLDLCHAGIVLTGGGAKLRAIEDIADAVLRMPVRVALPATLNKMPAGIAEPEFASAIGMALYTARMKHILGPQEQTLTAKLKSLFARRA